MNPIRIVACLLAAVACASGAAPASSAANRPFIEEVRAGESPKGKRQAQRAKGKRTGGARTKAGEPHDHTHHQHLSRRVLINPLNHTSPHKTITMAPGRFTPQYLASLAVSPHCTVPHWPCHPTIPALAHAALAGSPQYHASLGVSNYPSNKP